MKILTLKWDCFGYTHIRHAFEKAGHTLCEVDFPRDKEDARNSEKLATIVLEAIQKNKAEIVFSFNYFPVAAIAAYASKIKYISWTYDSPYMFLYSKTIELPTNFAFVFDQAEYINLKNKGINTVYYLPMAADTESFDKVILTETEKIRYRADIAMIGSMYSEHKNDLIRHFDGLDDYTAGYLEGIMDAQSQLYGVSILEKSLTQEVVNNIQKVCPLIATDDGLESTEWLFANYFVARKLTAIERKKYLEALSQHYKVSLYTPEKTPSLKRVENRGTVEYYKDFPKAVKCAKINLNISLRSIVSGIPLRAFDIMGCGGFLLTNYQSDFEGLFVPGEDYVYFESEEDLIEKAGYYLTHEEERMEIARNGYTKVKNYHTFDIRVKTMLDIAGVSE